GGDHIGRRPMTFSPSIGLALPGIEPWRLAQSNPTPRKPKTPKMKKLTNQEITAMMQADTPLNRARQAFTNAYGAIEQAGQQRVPATIFEIRQMEFEAVEKIAEILGVKLTVE